MICRYALLVALLLVLPIVVPGMAAAADAIPPDARLERARTLNDYHPFHVPADRAAWEARAQRVRDRILVAAGLWPMPPASPARAVVHGAIDRGAYTVEKVFFQSWPGFYVTGNLYRPKGDGPARRPAVLCPHGHWANGRFYRSGDKDAQAEVARGAERTLAGARYPLQARCATLARLGCVVFHYDMVGYADSRQIPHGEAFGDVEAALRLQNMFGVQTYNSIRALDFLMGLDDVDSGRVAVTGASGGGTQTFFLCAIDPRPAVAFPAVMVSTAMQGGCTCENAALLRADGGNVEFAALTAPRPLGMTGANDWTIEIETKGLPELQRLYAMLGVPDRVHAKCFPRFGHNYNQVSREVMYSWVAPRLGVSASGPVEEPAFVPIPPAELSVFDAEHPLPAGAVDATGLRRAWTAVAARQLEELRPTDRASFERYRDVVGRALRAILVTETPSARAVEARPLAPPATAGGLRVERVVLARPGERGRVPAVWCVPKSWQGDVVVALAPAGSGEFVGEDGQPRGVGAAVVERGAALLAVDVLLAGPAPTDGGQGRRLPVDSERHRRFYGYTHGYNRTLLAERIHDGLTAIAHASAREGARRVHLLGVGEAGWWALLAGAAAGDRVHGVAAQRPTFRYSELESVDDPRFLPGALRYGGWPGFAALCASGRLVLCGGGDVPPLLRAAYSAAGSPGNLVVERENVGASAIAALLR